VLRSEKPGVCALPPRRADGWQLSKYLGCKAAHCAVISAHMGNHSEIAVAYFENCERYGARH
jgi:hypothetical protein